MIELIRAPRAITHIRSGETLKLAGFELGTNPLSLYFRERGDMWKLKPYDLETEYSYVKPETPRHFVSQGKFECAPAAFSALTGHSLFQVKRVMGDAGWRNDNKGAGDRVMRAAALAFGHDLVRCGRRSILALLEKMPPCILTVPSLNYKGRAHAVTWYDSQIIDPNYGRLDRRYWSPEWAPWTIDAHDALVLTKHALTDSEHREIKRIREKAGPEEIRQTILAVAV
jgi:hypothetical protein